MRRSKDQPAAKTPLSIFLLLLLAMPLVPSGSGGDPPPDQAHGGPLVWTLLGNYDLKGISEAFPLGGSSYEYYLVQFDGPVTREMRSSLTERGFSIIDYIPDFTFVVKLNGRSANPFEGIENLHGTAPFPVGMKISPVLYEMLVSGTPDPDFQHLVVETFVPSDDVEVGLLLNSPWVERVTSTRYFVGLPVISLEAIASMDDVKWIEPRGAFELKNDVSQGLLDVDYVRSTYGLDGTGQTVAIADTGIDTGVDNHSVDGDVHLDFDNRLIIRDWSGTGSSDGHGHGTHVAGSVAGDGTRSDGSIQGMAPNATIVFQSIWNGAYLTTPNNLSLMFKQAYDLGARVHTNSWGSDSSALWGVYTTDSYQVDWSMYHYPDQLILFAAGNDGNDANSPYGKIDPDSISPPSTAKSTVTVGASENLRPGFSTTWASFVSTINPISADRVANNANGLAAFSSRGPMNDGRLKPDVVAPGTYVLSTKSSIPGASGGWASYNSYYHYNGGTSMSTPITAGTATVVRQYFNETEGLDRPLNSLIKAALINGAIDMTPGQYGSGTPQQEITKRPDNDQGWGRVNLEGSLYPEAGNMDYVNHEEGLRTNENFTRVFRVNSPEELRVTLAWSDYPGSLFAGKQLINDLNLVLTAPNGTVYNGNDYTAPFNDEVDSLNPVEGVTVPSPEVGWWQLEVKGYNVPIGFQHFGLVMSGNTTDLIINSMIFDRKFYSTENAEIGLRLTGKDLIGSGIIDVNISSDSDPLGKTVKLLEEGEYGSFTGSIATSNTSTMDPAKLYVRHDDNIYAWFNSVQHGVFYDAFAVAKDPRKVMLQRLPENHLIYSDGDTLILEGSGTIGAAAQWTIDGSSLDWLTLHDDGNPVHGDEIAGDGLYGSRMLIMHPMREKGMVRVRVNDPFLGLLYYPQFPLEIDTEMPRAPRGLKAEPLPQGNTVLLSWKRSSEPDMSHHTVYVNSTSLDLSYDEDGWTILYNTTDKANFTIVNGLADGVEYYFRVATVNETGVTSSPSVWAGVTPADTTAPTLNDGDPYTLAGEVTLSFHADPDLAFLEVEYYSDINGNGLADDNGTWLPAGNSTTSDLIWDTREEAGGPGNLEHMIIRARGADEVPNMGEWLYLDGYSVDNVGPNMLQFDTFPGRITKIPSYDNLLGKAEPLSFIYLYVNGALQNSTQVGSSGVFGLSLLLEEGYNSVNLTGYDRHGAGPVTVHYEFTLDTQPPTVRLSRFNKTHEIDHRGMTFNSTSFDSGLDPEFAFISNQTWEITLPTGERRIGYGESFHMETHYLGNHVLKLTIKDMAGNVNSTMVPFLVQDTTAPVPKVTGELSVNEDTSVEFSSEGTTDNDPLLRDSRITRYNWTFWRGGDWTYHSERDSTSVVFPQPGSYNGMLTVVDRSGNGANREFSVRVLDITPPTGSIIGPSKIIFGELSNFTANFTDNDPSVFGNASYQWMVEYVDEYGKTFKRGEYEGNVLSIVFDDPGNYSLTLKVIDPAGNMETAKHRVWAWEPPTNIEEEGLTPEERSWTMIIIIAVVVLVMVVVAVVVAFILTREKVKDVKWAEEEDDEEDEDLDDVDLEEEDDFEFDLDDDDDEIGWEE
ncbi:MAG: S8 family serine peptidase [Thermoplasmatota archaeon]